MGERVFSLINSALASPLEARAEKVRGSCTARSIHE
jgi:hypothetical protein